MSDTDSTNDACDSNSDPCSSDRSSVSTTCISDDERAVIDAQNILDKQAEGAKKSAAVVAAEQAYVKANGAYENKKREIEKARKDADSVKETARLQADLDFKTAKQGQSKPGCDHCAVRILEETLCMALHKAEVAHCVAVQKETLDLKLAEHELAMAAVKKDQACALADKQLAYNLQVVKVKYWTELCKAMK